LRWWLGLINISSKEVAMTKMNWDRANKIQRTGKAQSEHAEADRPAGISVEDILRTPEQVAAANEHKFQLEEEQREIEESRRLKEAEGVEERNIRRAEFLKNNEHLLQEFTGVLECKPDGSDAWIQLQKLVKKNPDEKSKYWLAYHQLNDIVKRFY